MGRKTWKEYYAPSILNFTFFLVIDICVLFGVCFGICKFINRVENKDVIVAEVVSIEESNSSFEEYFSESPTSSEFNPESFVDELRAKKIELETYLNETNLSGPERLAIANALSNLELAIGNVEIVVNEVD